MTDLRDWLDDLRAAGCWLSVDGRAVVIHGRPTRDDDRPVLARYRHALITAAAGTHPAWWDHVAGRTDQPPTPEQLPVADDDPDAFACATCGAPAAHLDPQLLPFCDHHWSPHAA